MSVSTANSRERAAGRLTKVGHRLRSAEALRHLGWLPLILVLSSLIVLPVLALQLRAFDDGGRAFRTMLEIPAFGRTAFNTAALAVGSMLVAVPTGVVLAWMVVHSPRRIRPVITIIPFVPLVLPTIAGVIGWAFLLSPRVGYINTALRSTPFFNHLTTGPIDVFSRPWIIIITGFILTSFVYLFVYVALRQMSGRFSAAAQVSGASAFRTFFTVTVPLLRPTLVYSAGIVLLLGLGQFAVPLLLGGPQRIRVLTTEMFFLRERFPLDESLGAALGTPLLVVGIALVFAQRYALRNQRRFATHGDESMEPRGSWWAAVPVVMYGVIAIGLPVAALVYVSLSPFWSGDLILSGLSIDSYRTVLGNPAMREAIRNSVVASVSAAALTLPIGFVAALSQTPMIRLHRSMKAVIDIVAMLPLAVPTALFGFAFLYVYTRPPFQLYGSVLAIVIAYITLMVPHATRAQLGSLASLGDAYWQASRVSGAGTARTVALILFPLARRGVAAAGAVTLVLLFHEFTASVMIRSTTSQVMGTILYETWNVSLYPTVAATAVIMLAVTTLGVIAALALGGFRSQA